jgi:hypothetical protein
VPEQPAPACRWLDIWHKAKSHIRLFQDASVVMVKQQDGHKKYILIKMLAPKVHTFLLYGVGMCVMSTIAEMVWINDVRPALARAAFTFLQVSKVFTS